MKILVFEYITGGGLSDKPLPDSLANEGGLMFRELLRLLCAISNLYISVTLDWRLSALDYDLIESGIRIFRVKREQTIDKLLPELIARHDAVWPIAPETDNILGKICQLVEDQEKVLLSSSALASTLAGNKLATYQCLQSHHIPTVATKLLSDDSPYTAGEWVLKPLDGVGGEGSYVVGNDHEYKQARTKITNTANYLIQPFIQGTPLSFSCLFGRRRAWLLCINEQHIQCRERKFVLTACTVNVESASQQDYDQLIAAIGRAIPELWGYVGIDIIDTKQGPVVMEINPRLTTSFAGIEEAIGLNVAESVLQLLVDDVPEIKSSRNHETRVNISGQHVAAA